LGVVRFALRFPHTFSVLAALIVFLGITAIRACAAMGSSGDSKAAMSLSDPQRTFSTSAITFFILRMLQES
jgi:hypothetical protein